MKDTIPEKSKEHEAKIKEISNIIVNTAKDKIAIVILFGSFARGTWVRDRYIEDGVLYQYSSDYDFLIITKAGKQLGNSYFFDLERKIDKELEKQGFFSKFGHNPHYIIESIDYINSELEKSQYFFSDIRREGILLFDCGEFKLSEPKKLNTDERKKIAKEDYDHWMHRADGFFNGCEDFLKKNNFELAAFMLHQATESLYNCALLNLGGYKPKSHYLVELKKLCAVHSHEFLTIFPLATEEQKACIKLLQQAYIDARYNKNYTITKKQLEYLIIRVKKLKDLVEKLCEDKI
jgi:HEPN domain-containing protein/predicted nucleotidyltransferase